MALKQSRPHATSVPALPKGRRTDVTRREFNRIIDRLNERGEIIKGILRTQEIQFQRIAQIQAELDSLVLQIQRLNDER